MKKYIDLTVAIKDFSEKDLIEQAIKHKNVHVKSSYAAGLFLIVDTDQGLFHLKYLEAKEVKGGQPTITYRVMRAVDQ